MKALLEKLGIEPVNPGACSGEGRWLSEPGGKELVSYNPTTGEPIARVVQATPAIYEQVAAGAQAAFLSWRSLPAPKRGLLVRDLGDALREMKEPLGDLVSLEMGKIRAEGHGEVQEMIDICDFAVGLSRQLYGLTMHSERPGHRMYEQWHPLGVLGRDHRLQLPGGGLVVERRHRRRVRRHGGVEAVLRDAADRHRRAEDRQPGDGGPRPGGHLQPGDRAGQRRGRAAAQRPARAAGLLHRLDPDGRARRRGGRAALRAHASWSWAATTPSSSPKTPTWTWRCAPSCSARWARPDSAAPPPGG